jgi:hypothetical protein
MSEASGVLFLLVSLFLSHLVSLTFPRNSFLSGVCAFYLLVIVHCSYAGALLVWW